MAKHSVFKPHAATARPTAVYGLRMCDAIIVRHRETFWWLRVFEIYVPGFLSILFVFIGYSLHVHIKEFMSTLNTHYFTFVSDYPQVIFQFLSLRSSWHTCTPCVRPSALFKLHRIQVFHSPYIGQTRFEQK